MNEQEFQRWYAQHAKRLGLNPNPDDPQHFYDYRAAYAAGAGPDQAGHWPSKFKKQGHPNRYVGGIDTITGEAMANNEGIDFKPKQDEEIKFRPKMNDRQTWADAINEGILNLIPSTGEMLWNTGKALTVDLPKTAKGMYGLGSGLISKLIPGEQDSEKYVDMLVEHYKGRYGNVENLKRTIAKDPAGFLADASTVLGLGGGALKLAGKASHIGALTKAGNVASTAGRAIEPLHMTTSLLKKPVGALATQVLGKSSAYGPEAVRRAYRGSETFTEGLRGKYDLLDAVDEARAQVKKLKDIRGTEYQQRLKEIEAASNITVNKGRIAKKLSDLFDSWYVKVTTDSKGNVIPDFSGTGMSRDAWGPVSQITKDVLEWNDWTPSGADRIARRVHDFYGTSKEGNAFVSAMNRKIRDEITAAIPQYKKMTQEYSKLSRRLEEADKFLSLGNADTASRKLATALRDVNPARRRAISYMPESDKIADMIAGSQMNAWTPRGYLPTVVPGMGLGLMAAATHSPWTLAGAAALSPRIVGEAALGAGKIGKAINAATQPFPWWTPEYFYQATMPNRIQGE